eukprot:m.230429 g.230429  ORF g.230429 m.230429 type:complete len:174 (+) comp16000_c0_seq1:123-644(+)
MLLNAIHQNFKDSSLELILVKVFLDQLKHLSNCMFNTKGLNVDDLKRHTHYIGGYTGGHKVISWLWQIVGDMSAEDQGKFLKFITSCSKPPVLGFCTLNPPLTVRAITNDSREDGYSLGSSVINFFRPGTDTERLPTSSTCFNLLKLPIYKSKKILKQKLLYAINSGAGFELS